VAGTPTTPDDTDYTAGVDASCRTIPPQPDAVVRAAAEAAVVETLRFTRAEDMPLSSMRPDSAPPHVGTPSAPPSLVRQIGFAPGPALATLTWDSRSPPPTSKPKSLTTLQGEPS
jgi:hypothetical protein